MTLQFKNVSLQVQGESYLNNIDASFERGSFNVLLGRTLAGKTSLLRLMAGLDRPSSGQLTMDGTDVTRLPVQQRKVSMVYQQFINYPNMSVYENIASPLRIVGEAEQVIDKKVRDVAELLRIEDFLLRRPLELSGGQQQRTSMARALVKDSDLILFDEPLVNLDYKLREELRSELRTLLKQRDTIAVYASSDPAEALAFGGNATVLHEGRVIQTGDVAEVYQKPTSVQCAELLSEPPINLINAKLIDNANNEPIFALASGQRFALSKQEQLPKGDYLLGLRPHHLKQNKMCNDGVELDLVVDVAELSGSETYLHLSDGIPSATDTLVAQLKGVHDFSITAPIKMYFSPADLYVFDSTGRTVGYPAAHSKGRVHA